MPRAIPPVVQLPGRASAALKGPLWGACRGHRQAVAELSGLQEAGETVGFRWRGCERRTGIGVWIGWRCVTLRSVPWVAGMTL